MNILFSGREKEQQILKDSLSSENSEMIAVIGRRRVGKTRLIRHTYEKVLDFEMTGIQNASLKDQLHNFSTKLRESSKLKTVGPPNNWFEAFEQLKKHLSNKKTKRKKVLFFDELPWLSSPRSKFLQTFAHFWNDWAAHNQVVIVICGSAASWMIKNILHHKGGLHNRITQLIKLKPFNLCETEQYLLKRKIKLSKYQIAQLYLVFGGIPHYLKEIKRGESVAQTIDRVCFTKYGLLYDEFEKLLTSLYNQSDIHNKILRALSTKWLGLSRQEILALTKLKDGGSINRALGELEESNFLSQIQPFDAKKKGTLSRLTDHYILFYLKFMEQRRSNGKGTFINLMKSSKWTSWTGYAFENLCMTHTDQIKQALGVAAVYTEISSYQKKGNGNSQGTQIDMLLDRADGTINVCEMKFYDGPYTISKKYAQELRLKKTIFRDQTRTRKTIFITFITSYGLTENAHSIEMVDHSLNMDVLFKPS